MSGSRTSAIAARMTPRLSTTADTAAPDAIDASVKPTRNAGDTRARILAAACVRFSADAYENVGTRDIAADAGVDAALVNRYFGGKEKLFEEAIAGAFLLDEELVAEMATFGEQMTRRVMDESDPRHQAKFDALGLLLRSAGSPVTSALVAARFHTEFVEPLAKRLRGRDAGLRAGLIASYVIGLATMKLALGSPVLGSAAQRKTIAIVGAAIQACVTG
jgi:AcrR family transcriptional regulator